MTPDAPEPQVRALRGDDRAAWQTLWDGYLAFYGEDVDADTTDVVFQRLVDPGVPAQRGFVVELEGEVLGLAHVLVHPSTWAVEDDCYLEDLFVDPSSRGAGLGRALIAHLVELAADEGWRRVHWLTDTDNVTARRLYDELGTLQDQVRYAVTRDAPTD